LRFWFSPWAGTSSSEHDLLCFSIPILLDVCRQSSHFSTPSFRLHLTQCLDRAVEIALQLRLVASDVLKGTPHDSLYLEVIDFLMVAVLRTLKRLDYLALYDTGTTHRVGVTFVLASNSPNDHPLAVPPAIKRKIIVANGQFKIFVKNAAYVIWKFLTPQKFADLKGFHNPEFP